MVDFVGNCEDRPPNHQIFWLYTAVTSIMNISLLIFSDSLASVKIKCTKYNMRNINDNAVQGRLSDN